MEELNATIRVSRVRRVTSTQLYTWKLIDINTDNPSNPSFYYKTQNIQLLNNRTHNTG